MHPLIEKLDKEFYETDFEPSWMSSSMEVSKTKLKSYLHYRDQALIEGIIDEIVQLTKTPENEQRESVADIYNKALNDIINILNSFKPKR